MASQSTSIADLPRTNNSQNDEDPQESMMVNSILREIENEEELNDENEDTLKYTMDTSQIPPKINNEIPTKEIIEILKKNANAKFDESIDISLRINLKQSKGGDLSLRTVIKLPNGSGKKEIIEILRQKSRPYLFSNTLAPSIVGASLKVFELIEARKLFPKYSN